MHSFKHKFRKERKKLEDIESVIKTKESIVCVSNLKYIHVLKIYTKPNTDDFEDFFKNSDLYRVRDVKGEKICVKNKDKKYKIRILSKFLAN